MARPLDHLVIAARDLDEGAAYVHERLGVEMQAGGKHATMGTHNRVLALGGGAYLEVIAIDPEGAAPSGPRWMSLDSRSTRAMLAAGPALLHWVERSVDLEGEVPALPDKVRIQSFERGPYRWRMALTPDGSLPGRGLRPTLIQWEGARAGDALADAGCRLLDRGAADGGEARFATASGERTIPWRLPPE